MGSRQMQRLQTRTDGALEETARPRTEASDAQVTGATVQSTRPRTSRRQIRATVASGQHARRPRINPRPNRATDAVAGSSVQSTPRTGTQNRVIQRRVVAPRIRRNAALVGAAPRNPNYQIVTRSQSRFADQRAPVSSSLLGDLASSDEDDESMNTEADPINPQCPICQSSMSKRRPVTMMCGHLFCRRCIKRSLRFKPECPICRQLLASQRCFINVYLEQWSRSHGLRRRSLNFKFKLKFLYKNYKVIKIDYFGLNFELKEYLGGEIRGMPKYLESDGFMSTYEDLLWCIAVASKWMVSSFKKHNCISLRDAFISPELITRNLHARSFAFISFAFWVHKSFFGSLLVVFRSAH